MSDLQYTHLLYVHKYSLFKDDYKLFVYGVNTNDIYHTIGEYLTQCIEQVKRIDYAICTQEKIDYWENSGYKIWHFKEKHKVDTERHAHWKKQKPNPHQMKMFHNAGIGTEMNENSVFWVCSECHGWGTKSHKYCSNCGCKMDKTHTL